MESARAALSRAMRVHATEESTSEPDDVILCVKPQGLRANRDFARGELRLVPYVGMAYITHNPKNTASVIDSGHTAKTRRSRGEVVALKAQSAIERSFQQLER